MAAEAKRPRVPPHAPDDEPPLEAPEADVAEQRTADSDDVEQRPELSLETGPEVPEADALEQALEVPEDEDDYR
ncbi:hypothetical protein [Thermobifida cellulosilytica]|uniref:Uncharacterized protein n=1 Tax=Thermobifida cellulosilytica TB100 TaxID=665004 RepID=A0A147KH23_THECS|nr:hypothetical protein [Thermobifida cellulosilytica]KUP96598.1 hypothetical protein AC529_11475 [Thermobifida cellulosilytica TB100]